MKHIKLFGEIAEKYEKEFRLDVASVGEACRAINANHPGFINFCSDNYVLILVDYKTETARQVVDRQELWGDEVLYIFPRIDGEFTAAIVLSAVGAVAGAAAAAAVPAFVASAIAFVLNVALSLAISAIASMISGDPASSSSELLQNSIEAPEDKPSYILDGVRNTARQGRRIPVAYGTVLVGSMVASTSLHNEDIL